ncbi:MULTISPECIES: IucA/IucC family protein [unclassified Streptomyces]|uniref:IucA/IucC family protein n=1 Tax=unclassified Streptomyces TaxID=2593676 RepID=UPI0003643EA8|nr:MULTISPECIES: IucA/IucC family protein [unclassified Streptomyces]MYT33164.1 IucA/IucC family siderophore biosynthesis protein [Streptomyces sp. SID8354]
MTSPTLGTPAPGTAASDVDGATADVVTAHTLLNCLVREVSGPERQVIVADGHLLVRLPRRGVLLRVALRRQSLIGAHRFSGPPERCEGAAWSPLGSAALADLIRAELTSCTGADNGEFTAQVAASRATIRTVLTARRAHRPSPDAYLASEQSLVYGHRFHPTPKSRSGDPHEWLEYGPETGSRFALRHLAVRPELLYGEGDSSALDALGPARPGHLVLPAHPWQYRMLSGHRALRAALARGDVHDLGSCGPLVAPTASVRTVYEPAADVFLKFSLNVRLTNCVRKNSAYELAGAVVLHEVVQPVFAALRARYPGCGMLGEPGYRSLDLDGSRDLHEGFGVIVREGFGRHLPPAVTPLLAAAVADEYPNSPAHVSRLLARRGSDPLAWWDAYLGLLLPPVLAAYFEHGLVLEPHLQNVVVGVRADGMPAHVLFRDLEGTKLVPERHHRTLAALDEETRGPLTYSAARGWDRVAYCLLVNHVAEMVSALADTAPALEASLWGLVHDHIAAYAADTGNPPRLRALLSGVPLPAKANLLLRWARQADRHATYVPLPSPLSDDFPRQVTP